MNKCKKKRTLESILCWSVIDLFSFFRRWFATSCVAPCLPHQVHIRENLRKGPFPSIVMAKMRRFESRPAGRTTRSQMISVYECMPISRYDAEDGLQRFGKLKIGATSCTISEPVLEQQYDVAPSPDQDHYAETSCLRQKRIQGNHRAFEAAKHLCDLAVVAQQPRIQQLNGSSEQMNRLSIAWNGIPGVKPQAFTFLIMVPSARHKSAVMNLKILARWLDRFHLPFSVPLLDPLLILKDPVLAFAKTGSFYRLTPAIRPGQED